ncbi:excisionase family DNA binding protein [Bradyrhizobium diazoefficiens]
MSKREDSKYLRNAELAKYLNVTKMTLWRWQRDRALRFPQPSVIHGISYTDVEQIDQWMKARVVDRARSKVA